YYEGWGFESGLLFFIASGVMLISTIPMFFVPEGGIGKKGISSKTGNASISKQLLMFLLAMLFINFGINSVALMKSQYLALDEGFDVSSGLLSYIVNTGSFAIFVVGLLVRRISDRFRDEMMLLIGTMTAILYLTGFAVASNLPMIFVSNFLYGASNAIIVASSYSFASRLIQPERRGRYFAFFNATLFLSWGLPGTFIVGPIVDQLITSGSTQAFAYRTSFVTAAILTFSGALILVLVIRMNKHGRKAS
ncbi:MAG: MFS transporter, partial [Candidatus Bathyarchaeota archaeon]